MPQEIRVLRCYKCKMFQVDIVKKAKKWQCKICQEKQSVFREFFRGSGAHCRLKVQELNLNNNDVQNKSLGLLDIDDLDIDLDAILKENITNSCNGQLKIKDSNWAKYVESKQKEEIVEPTEPPSKLKRNSNSTSVEAEYSGNNFSPSTSTSSKW